MQIGTKLNRYHRTAKGLRIMTVQTRKSGRRRISWSFLSNWVCVCLIVICYQSYIASYVADGSLFMVYVNYICS